MNWRDLMTAPTEADNPLTHNTHNTQNPPPAGSSADIADIALEESAPAASLEPDAPAVRWLVMLADGEQFILRATPPCTRAEVEARHPGARVEIEPDPASLSAVLEREENSP